MLLGKTKSLLCNLILLVEIIELNAIIAFADLVPRILLISVVQVYDLVELDAVSLQLLNVVLSLRESK